MQKVHEILPLNLAGFRRGASPRMPGACVTLMGLRLPEDLKPTVDNQQQAQVIQAHTHASQLPPIWCPPPQPVATQITCVKFDYRAATCIEPLTMEPATCCEIFMRLYCICRLWAQH